MDIWLYFFISFFTILILDCIYIGEEVIPMAAANTLQRSLLKIVVSLGMQKDGKEKSSSIVFYHTNPDATTEDFEAVGKALASLQMYDVKHIVRVDEHVLSA